LTRAVEETLARTKDLEVLPSAADEAEAASRVGVPRLFLLDACSLRTDLGPLAQRCRAASPGSKFIALLAPESANFAQELRLFYWGIDGFVKLDRTWQTELPEAIRSILGGQIWVPSQVLSAFAQQAKALQDVQFLAGQSLTAREGQVLQLLMRHLPNKDISKVLAISERTAKFHVSNILAKLGFEGRNDLLPENFARLPSTSARSADSLNGRARRNGISSESEHEQHALNPPSGQAGPASFRRQGRTQRC
jgi:two-component system, NarL family, response regulator DevR